MAESKKITYLRGAAILGITAIIVKILSAVFKMPLYNLLGDSGTTNFTLTYSIYSLLLTVSTSGISVALSRQISTSIATGRQSQVKRIFLTALPAFTLLGTTFMVIMYINADKLAILMGDNISKGIRTLSPAVLFCCVMATFEGYAQGHGNMIPTAVKQLIEVTSKLVLGFAIARWLIAQGNDVSVVSSGAILGITIGLGLALIFQIIYKRTVDAKSIISTSERDIPLGRLKTLVNIFKVSIPITLGSSLISLLTLIDYRLVLLRLQSGAGLTEETAKILSGAYSKAQAISVLTPSLIIPLSVSIVPALATAIARNNNKAAKDIMGSSIKLTHLIALPAGVGICVLSNPIFNVIFPNSDKIGPTLLTIFGIASIFVCMQIITTAILQANGYEKIPIITFPIGGIIQILIDWILVGNTNIGIVGSPIGTLTCYLLITIMNFSFIGIKIKNKPKLLSAFVKTALCTAIMGVTAWFTYDLLLRLGTETLGTSRLANAIYLFGAISVAILIYCILIIATNTINRADLKLLPKGENISNFFNLK